VKSSCIISISHTRPWVVQWKYMRHNYNKILKKTCGACGARVSTWSKQSCWTRWAFRPRLSLLSSETCSARSTCSSSSSLSATRTARTYIITEQLYTVQLNFGVIANKRSAVAEMGDRGHSRHGPKKVEAAVPHSRG